MNIGIVGLGLIGGSIAKSIKRETPDTVLGYDINVSTTHKARLLEAIDLELTEERIGVCDMILIALYPNDIVQWVEDNSHRFKPDCIVMDCGGVKESICNRLFPHAEENGYCFVGAHPMAGVERWGFDNAQGAMFKNSSILLVPPKGIGLERLQRIKKFWGALGFGNIEITTAAEHDRRIAFTSQLAHVVSSAYIKSPTAQLQHGFSAGSYKDMTRVARLNEAMWSELFLENAEHLTEEIDGMLAHLQEFREAVAGKDREKLTALLREGRELKELADREDMEE
ncbi:MAG TPA: prephenate dehydrogenase/arogenate dehydrogenase family protein [Clostridiales bacterium]|nr:prephenate dehydrogenase/arogenate dehydrogenase family protein [Clostridiales bacterium]